MRKILVATAALCLCMSPALAGPKDCTCSAVKAKGDGWCAHCKEGMVCGMDVKSEKLYKAMEKSAYHAAIAKGEMVKAADCKCADCKKMLEGHKDGWCKKCNAGMVAGHVFKDKASYEKAEDAMKVLRKADKTKCGGCAVAMVEDGKCSHCKVSYKDGKATKS